MRAFVAASILAVLTILAAPAAHAAEIDPPVGGCLDDDATVQVCQPVCVTYPCNPYVCVNTRIVDECYYP